MTPCELLLFAAHCDDGELWAGGTIARIAKNGNRVVLAIAHHDEDRRREAEAGAAVLGCDLWFRDKDSDTQEWVQQCLEAARPNVLATHPRGDPHFEHDSLGTNVLRALTLSRERKQFPKRWYWFDTYYSTQSVGLPLIIDISGEFDQKCEALKCHRSQEPESLVAMALAINALHGHRIRAAYAEAFYIFPLLGRWPRLREEP